MSMRISARNLLALVILLLAGALSVVVVHNLRSSGPEEVIDSVAKNVDLSLKKLNYTETRAGVRRWALVADSAEHSAAGKLAHLENIRMTFYDQGGRHADITLTARQGEIHTETRVVTVRGRVVVHSARGYTFYTQRLQYREADRMIRTDAPVRMVSATMEVTGTGLRFDVRSHALKLLAHVRARLQGVFGRKKWG